MKVFIGKDYDEMSQIAAVNHLLSYMYRPDRVNLAITAESFVTAHYVN